MNSFSIIISLNQVQVITSRPKISICVNAGNGDVSSAFFKFFKVTELVIFQESKTIEIQAYLLLLLLLFLHQKNK